MATTVHFDESEDILDIRFDNVFKAVFTKESSASKIALSRLVSAIIGRDVSVLTLAANEPAPESLRDRQLRFDINCRTKDGELVNVEMSLNPKPFEPVRLEYQIAILAKEEFFGDGDFFHAFEYYDPVRGVSLGGRSRIMTLELAKVGSVAQKPIEQMSNREQWAMFFQYLTDPKMRGIINAILKRKEAIAMAAEVLLTISRDEVERARLRSEEKNLLDIQSDMAHERREGRREGMEKGTEKGRRESRMEVLNLIAGGYTAEDIRKELENRG